MALLSRAPRNATLIAKTDGEVLRIPQEAFEKLLSSSTTAAMAVLHWVMARLTQNEIFVTSTGKDGRTRHDERRSGTRIE